MIIHTSGWALHARALREGRVVTITVSVISIILCYIIINSSSSSSSSSSSISIIMLSPCLKVLECDILANFR